MRTVNRYVGLAFIQRLFSFIKGIRFVKRIYMSRSGFTRDENLMDHYHMDIERAFTDLHFLWLKM